MQGSQTTLTRLLWLAIKPTELLNNTKFNLISFTLSAAEIPLRDIGAVSYKDPETSMPSFQGKHHRQEEIEIIFSCEL